MSRAIIGIDPGQAGGIAIGFEDGKAVAYTMPQTERDVFDLLLELIQLQARTKIYMEHVHSMPKQGVSSTFKFGQGYGFLRGVITALCVPFEEVSPQKWQRALGIRPGSGKNGTKQKAQQLFPDLKITHKTADALLICEYGKRCK